MWMERRREDSDGVCAEASVARLDVEDEQRLK